jgi:hypothetical protein
VHVSRGRDQARQLDQCVDRDETRPDGERGAGHAIGHPQRNRGRLLRFVAQPQLATRADTTPHEDGLSVQRMPRIVNSDLLSVVGGM